MQFELGITKNGWVDTKNQIAQATSVYPSPREFLRQHTHMVDGLVRKAFQRAQLQASHRSVCLIAVGGFGRAELAPCSDVDLLLLHSSRTEDLSPLNEKILYPLWDLGIDVSCSSRSISECLRMAQSDLHVKTGLIDGRYLDGEYGLFRNLHDLFTKKVLHRNIRGFAEALARDLRLRRQKYEDPSYVLEPNIKDGKGGLRDFQIGRWIVRAKYKTDRWDSILFPDHSRTLDESLQFLWAVRNRLHQISGRKQDDLTFESQEKIAPALGFSGGTKGVEEMMRRFHLSAQKISGFVDDVLERVLHEPSPMKKAFFHFRRKKIDENFGIFFGEVHLIDPVTLKRDPPQLMTLFEHCQIQQVKMDYRTEEAVIEALPFVDDHFRDSEEVNRTFLSILRRGKGADGLLKKMHELEFLSAYIPEFSGVEGRVHYDLYHVHPVDIHSLLAVEELGKLREGYYQKEFPLLTSLAGEVEKPDILLLTTLLHDIGKGGEGDHSSVGAGIAKRIASRMGLSAEDGDLVEFLVGHHLSMLETAFRRDVHDEQTILRFASEVEGLTRLKMLYLLTFADIKAVGPEAWTSWKDSLLMELFLRTSHLLENEALRGPFLNGEAMIEKLKKALPPDLVSIYSEHLPDRYLSCFSPEEIRHHLEMARSLKEETLVVEWEVDKEIRAKVTVCTEDRYGLFSKIAGSMFLNRLNILEAQIHTWGNDVALDTFWVEDSTKEIEQRLKQFENDLKQILSGKVSLRDLLSKKEEAKWVRQKVVPGVSPEVKINNGDSDFYTIVEIVGKDRMGILHEITQALTDHGCNIHFARISTLGNRIVDVFYVQDSLGEKIEGKNKIDQLERTLLRLMRVD